MGDVTLTDLMSMQTTIANAVGEHVRQAEKNILLQISEVQRRQDITNGRVNKHEAQIAALESAREDAAAQLRTLQATGRETSDTLSRLDERTGTGGFRLTLTKRQKTLLVSGLIAAGGVLLQLGQQLVTWLHKGQP